MLHGRLVDIICFLFTKLLMQRNNQYFNNFGSSKPDRITRQTRSDEDFFKKDRRYGCNSDINSFTHIRLLSVRPRLNLYRSNKAPLIWNQQRRVLWGAAKKKNSWLCWWLTGWQHWKLDRVFLSLRLLFFLLFFAGLREGSLYYKGRRGGNEKSSVM